MLEEDKNYFNEDAMTSPAVEQNKIKCPSCGQDLMTNPDTDEKTYRCPSCGEDLMTLHKKVEK